MCYSFLTLYTFLSLAYITFMAPFYKMAVIYYLLPVASLFILNILIPYLRAVYTILSLNKFC